jgi:hypothetical protein
VLDREAAPTTVAVASSFNAVRRVRFFFTLVVPSSCRPGEAGGEE